jgi:hypothetical protein
MLKEVRIPIPDTSLILKTAILWEKIPTKNSNNSMKEFTNF